METLAHLVTEIFRSLGFPPASYLEPEDVVAALRGTLAFYDLDLGQSNQNQVVNYKQFNTATREKEVGDIGGVPLWLSRQTGAGATTGWHFIPAVNFAAIEDAYECGDEACAFHARTDGKLRVTLSYVPRSNETYRLWFDPNPSVQIALGDPLRIPAAFYPMYVAHAVVELVTQMMLTAAKLPEGARPDEFTLAAWSSALDRANNKLTEFKPLWRVHKYASRGGARGRNRRPVLGR